MNLLKIDFDSQDVAFESIVLNTVKDPITNERIGLTYTLTMTMPSKDLNFEFVNPVDVESNVNHVSGQGFKIV
ncbi:MAG: hypothetical protein LBV67_07145 [Streptococcaceae bacterium]|jgi:hypothetical protein|nr:hypothetical protein [Streptococcaceae bacterium]